MDTVWQFLRSREPVAAQAVIVAALAMLTSFGLNWTGEQVGAVTGFTAVLLGFLTRSVVAPSGRVSRGDG